MTQILKQSTAVDVLIGPFVSSTDGYTADSGALAVVADVMVAKNGQALATKNSITVPTHDSAGYFNCEFDATDTNTVGNMILAVEGDTGHLPVRHEFQVVEELVYDRLFATDGTGADTGSISQAVWGATTRALTVFAHDTGIWASNAARSLTAFNHDTGVADTVWKTTSRTLTAFSHDTGVSDTVWKEAVRTLTAFSHDTGVADTVWKYSTSGAAADTGSVAYAQGRLMAVKGDTGAAHLDAGRLGVTAAVSLDTGATKDAVWQTTAGTDGRGLTESLNIDTGISDTVWKQAARTLTSFSHDTGVANTVWKESESTYTDTGSMGYAQNNPSDTGLINNAEAIRVATDKIQFDTGANEIHVDARKVNNVQLKGAGDTGLANTWRPVTEV